MKKEICVALATLLMSAPLIADENYSNLNVGPTFFTFRGKEESMNGYKEDKGLYVGARAEIEYAKPDSWYGALVGVIAPGAGTTTHYIKAAPFLGSDSLTTMKVGTYLWQVECRAGKHFKLMEKSSIVPYVSGGWYHVDSSITYTVNDAESKSGTKMNWFYAAAGVSGSYAVHEMVDLALNAKLMRHFYSKNELTVQDSVETVDMDAKWGYEIALPVKVKAGKGSMWNFQAEPFFLKIDTSRDVNVFGGRLSVQKAY